MQETGLRSLYQEDLLEEEIATHSGILAWEIPWTEEPGGLQSMGPQRVGHTERLLLTPSLASQWLSGEESAFHTGDSFDPWVGKIPWRKTWQPIPVFLPGKFHGQRSLAGYSPWGCKESSVTE